MKAELMESTTTTIPGTSIAGGVRFNKALSLNNDQAHN